MKHYFTDPNTVLYTNCAHLLYSLLKVDGSADINCNGNIGSLLSSLISSYECTMEVNSCTLCCFKEESKVKTLLLQDLKIIWINHYNNLEEDVNNYFNGKILHCQNCRLLTGLRQYTMRPYLWIDTDEAYRASTYANILNIEAIYVVINLRVVIL